MYPVNMCCPEFTDSNMEKRRKKKRGRGRTVN